MRLIQFFCWPDVVKINVLFSPILPNTSSFLSLSNTKVLISFFFNLIRIALRHLKVAFVSTICDLTSVLQKLSFIKIQTFVKMHTKYLKHSNFSYFHFIQIDLDITFSIRVDPYHIRFVCFSFIPNSSATVDPDNLLKN